MVFSWFHHENRLVAHFCYHIRNQRVKIHKYTKFEENRKIQLFGTLSPNLITTAEISITEYSEDLNLIIDAVNDGKHGIIHPQILVPKILIQELRTLEVNTQKYPIKLLLENY